jgi:UDP-N-acetylglucosamine/UDP-N-acetylgalactosamine 4-epimerase
MTTTQPPDFSLLRTRQRRWLITGVAGFIGSHLLEGLLKAGQCVTGLDDFSTGQESNLHRVRQQVGEEAWRNFRLLRGDIRMPGDCRAACEDAEILLHHAALVSVPQSIEKPALTHAINVEGFRTLLDACRNAGVRRVVYASSSAVYGDNPTLPLSEEMTPRPQSPYAESKLTNERDALEFGLTHSIPTIGLRYFNVYGQGQNPQSAYASVMTAWVKAMRAGKAATIYGDGHTTRDFCAVADVVAANLLAALTANPQALNRVYNIGTGLATSLLTLHQTLQEVLGLEPAPPHHAPPRAGDIRHSVADITAAQTLLGYAPSLALRAGLEHMLGTESYDIIHQE